MLEKMEEAPSRPVHTPPSQKQTQDLFTSDEFRLYCFKVLPCSKRFVHDWPSCPFAHPGEKAKRRDPRTHQYDCEMCPAVVKGETCELGAACPHSHHVFESWLHPQKYRTLLCKDGDQCHREVCFFAHGSKQLRTPDRGHQPRMAHQRYAPIPGPQPAHKQQQVQQQQPASCAPQQQLTRHASSNCQQQQQQLAVNGSDGSPMACLPVPTAGQLLGGQDGFGACDPCMSLVHPTQPQMLNGACANGDGCSPLTGRGSGSGDMMQLLQQLAAEVNASRQEAVEHSRVAAVAQQKLQLLEQALGCALPGAGSAYGCGYGTGSTGASTGGVTPLASPAASSWAAAPLAPGQQLPPAAPALPQLLAMQQLAAAQGGVYDGTFPRRHSLDEALLRRARSMPGWCGGNAGRSGALWSASPSAMVSSLAAVTEGMALSVAPGSEAAADVEALGAALAAARGPSMDSFCGMPAGGLVCGSSLLSSSVGHGSWMGSMQAPDSAGQVWSPQDTAWAGAVGMGGAFNGAAQQLPPIPHTSPTLNGRSSLSAPQVQGQAEYLAQMHAALQDSTFALTSLGMAPAPRVPVRASFDTAAAYMPSLGLQAAGGRGTPAGSVAAGEDVAGCSNGSIQRSSGGSNTQDAPGALPATLATNPIGGAHQLGWF